jgi:hypothetical protein
MPRRISLLILSLLVLANRVFAAPLPGASYIGMCNPKFPCEEALRALNVTPVKTFGYLADAFGHKCQCVKKFMADSAPKYVRVHLANGTCFPERGRRCGRYDVFSGERIKSAEIKVFKKNSRIIKRFRASIIRTLHLMRIDPTATVRYSLCLECPLSLKARKILLNEALKFIPLEQLVDSPLSGRCLTGLICERHGDNPRFDTRRAGCIADLDGKDLFNADIELFEKRSKNCEAIYYWTYGFNLLPYGYRGKFISPDKRTNKLDQLEFEGLDWCLKQSQ